ncbi:MAG TPA: zf-HC2 domain-containing protein [candidate division Zixibacteria bacterium]|nr:zf-HC2 domain-containing protein [candidate division Zixibacteria bacterium]MDD4916688.1 zf-HC2 domain-containing protein [candidate division Zixibacteria bacterium]MDM7973333.1 zf-HC2 domain-containing protein [candidate division Zixibacteria bacterium]HOD65960.1 zf-HC2 domain-containing protein [candidate division Zixibacteria bacterium]HOZ07995.1 zf-HC2 domain-containing protein [candidate division Zixibacteria bacterium]
MTCRECRDLLPALVLGEVSESDRPAVMNHLAACAACRSEFECLQSICSALTSDGEGGLSELERLRLENTVWRRLATPESAASGGGRFARYALRVAAALVLFGLGYFVRPHLGGAPAPAQPVASDRLEATLAALDRRELTRDMRFSATGFKVIAHGRKAVIEKLESASLDRPRLP